MCMYIHVYTFMHMYTYKHIYIYTFKFHVVYTYTRTIFVRTAPHKTYVRIFHVLCSYTWVLNPSYCITKSICMYITCIVCIYMGPELFLRRHKKHVHIYYMYCIHIHMYFSLPTASQKTCKYILNVLYSYT